MSTAATDTQPTAAAEGVALDSVRALALYQVLEMHLRFGGAALGISAAQALRNMGLIGPGQRATTAKIRHYRDELDRQLTAAGIKH